MKDFPTYGESGSLEKEAFRYTTQCGLDGCGSQSSHGNRVLLKREVRLSIRVGSSRVRIFVSSLGR